MTRCLGDSHLAYIKVNPALIFKYNRILNTEYIDFVKENLEENTTIYKLSVPFNNGYVATIEVYVGSYNANIAGILYDQNELELQRLDPIYDSLDNVFVFEVRGEEYVVNISKESKFTTRLS